MDIGALLRQLSDQISGGYNYATKTLPDEMAQQSGEYVRAHGGSPEQADNEANLLRGRAGRTAGMLAGTTPGMAAEFNEAARTDDPQRAVRSGLGLAAPALTPVLKAAVANYPKLAALVAGGVGLGTASSEAGPREDILSQPLESFLPKPTREGIAAGKNLSRQDVPKTWRGSSKAWFANEDARIAKENADIDAALATANAEWPNKAREERASRLGGLRDLETEAAGKPMQQRQPWLYDALTMAPVAVGMGLGVKGGVAAQQEANALRQAFNLAGKQKSYVPPAQGMLPLGHLAAGAGIGAAAELAPAGLDRLGMPKDSEAGQQARQTLDFLSPEPYERMAAGAGVNFALGALGAKSGLLGTPGVPIDPKLLKVPAKAPPPGFIRRAIKTVW